MNPNRTHAVALMATVLVGAAIPAQTTDFRAQAFAAHRAGRHAEAADLLMKLYRAGATDRQTLEAAAKSLEEVGRFNDALDVLSRAKKHFSADPGFAVAMARCFSRKAHGLLKSTGKLDSHAAFNFQDAIRETRTVLKQHPDNRDARLILAHSLFTLGKWDETKKQSEELVRRFPKHPGGHILMGDLAFEHYKLMRERMTKPGADTSTEALRKVAGAREAARQSYRRAIELDARRTAAHRKLGDLCAWNGESKAALQSYRSALLLDPSVAVSHSWIGTHLGAKERYEFYKELGESYLKRPGADRKKAALFVWYAAGAQTARGQHAAAEKLYGLAVSLNPSYVQGHYYAMYSAWYYRKDEDAALRHAAAYAAAAPVPFADLVKVLPDKARQDVTQLVRYLAARSMQQANAAASRDLNHVLAAIVDTADAWNNYAFMARESKQYAASEKAYRHALELEPTSGQLMNDLGVILHYHKNSEAAWREAEKLYRAAIRATKATLKSAKASNARKKIAAQSLKDATGNLAALRAAQAARRKARKAK